MEQHGLDPAPAAQLDDDGAEQTLRAWLAELDPNLTPAQREELRTLIAKGPGKSPNPEPTPDSDRPSHLLTSVRLRNKLEGGPLRASSPQLDRFDAETAQAFQTWPGHRRWQQRVRAAVLDGDDDTFDALADQAERFVRQIERARRARLHRQATISRRPARAPVTPRPSRSRRAGHRRVGARAVRSRAVRSGASPPRRSPDDPHLAGRRR